VAVPSGGRIPGELARAGVRHFAWEAVPQPGPGVLRELASLRGIVAEFDPDIVHLHSSKAGLVGRLLLRRSRPTLIHPNAWSFYARNGVVRELTIRWERLGARWADVIVAVSEDERAAGIAAGVVGRYELVPNGIDLERFTLPGPGARERARKELGLGDAPLAVCVGRLHRQKNQALLLDLWPRVRAEVSGARVALVGDGPDRAALEARAPDGVTFAGPTDDVRPWLDAATVMLQPSRWEAGSSLAVMEAMARGRSVVATDVAGMREELESGGGAGAVVAQGDAEALLRAIVERLSSPDLADAEGARGRKRVEERHDVRTQRAGIDRIYDELLARGRRG